MQHSAQRPTQPCGLGALGALGLFCFQLSSSGQDQDRLRCLHHPIQVGALQSLPGSVPLQAWQ